MAIPTWASARDGLSLTPSPTKATICPFSIISFTYSDLSSGSMFPWASVSPSSFATRSTVPWLSPESMTRFFTFSLFSLSKSFFTSGRILSRTPINTLSSPSTAVNTRELPFFSSRSISFFILSSR